MPSSISHAVAGVALASIASPTAPRRYWLAAAFCAVIPDVDVVAGLFARRDVGVLGEFHRGLTHSLLFALCLAVGMSVLLSRSQRSALPLSRAMPYFFLATASHGALDALTAYGTGVAFFAPLSAARVKFLWQPIDPASASIGYKGLVRVLAGLSNEFVWVWLPSLLLLGVVRLWVTRRQPAD